jgi:Uma2 family endonuclease
MRTLEPQPRVYTAEDLLCLSAQEERFELIRGELREMAPPGGEHGLRTHKLARYAGNFIEEQELGVDFAAETGFLIAQNPDTVKAPDWAFLAKERLSGPIPRKYVPLVPDIVLETRSPNDTAQEVAQKVAEWLEAGVKIVWELDPMAQVLTVHRADREPLALQRSDTLYGEEVLPGFELWLEKIFR